MRCMPFRWKFSPLLCHLAFQKVIAGIIEPHMTIFHCLDDFQSPWPTHATLLKAPGAPLPPPFQQYVPSKNEPMPLRGRTRD